MGKFFLILLFITHIFALDLSQSDKQKHILATGIISVLSDEIYCNYYKRKYNTPPSKTQRYIISISSGIITGFLKEMYDKSKSNNHFDHKDLQADILGSVLGSILKIEIKWR